MKCQGLTFKDSDSLNLHMIIFIVDNQPEINSNNNYNEVTTATEASVAPRPSNVYCHQ